MNKIVALIGGSIQGFRKINSTDIISQSLNSAATNQDADVVAAIADMRSNTYVFTPKNMLNLVRELPQLFLKNKEVLLFNARGLIDLKTLSTQLEHNGLSFEKLRNVFTESSPGSGMYYVRDDLNEIDLDNPILKFAHQFTRNQLYLYIPTRSTTSVEMRGLATLISGATTRFSLVHFHNHIDVRSANPSANTFMEAHQFSSGGLYTDDNAIRELRSPALLGSKFGLTAAFPIPEHSIWLEHSQPYLDQVYRLNIRHYVEHYFENSGIFTQKTHGSGNLAKLFLLRYLNEVLFDKQSVGAFLAFLRDLQQGQLSIIRSKHPSRPIALSENDKRFIASMISALENHSLQDFLKNIIELPDLFRETKLLKFGLFPVFLTQHKLNRIAQRFEKSGYTPKSLDEVYEFIALTSSYFREVVIRPQIRGQEIPNDVTQQLQALANSKDLNEARLLSQAILNQLS